MKAYLINLDRSHDRLQRMQGQFAKAGLEFIRVPAVDGRVMEPEELAKIKRNRGWEQPLSPSEIGCFLSHRRCYEQIVESGAKFAAVFEDDVTFSKNAQQFFASDDWIPDDVDIIKLETHGRKVLTGEPAAHVAGGFDVARLLSQNILSAGYIISGRCAAYLLERMNDAAAPMDHFLFTPACGFFKELKIYQVSPVICGQAGLESTLGAERQKDYQRPPVLYRIIRETKRPFKRLAVYVRGIYINGFTSKRWGKVAPLEE